MSESFNVESINSMMTKLKGDLFLIMEEYEFDSEQRDFYLKSVVDMLKILYDVKKKMLQRKINDTLKELSDDGRCRIINIQNAK